MSSPQSFRHMAPHDVLVQAQHDDLAHENFAQSMHHTVFAGLMPGNREAFESRVRPQFERAHRRAPRDRQEVRAAMRHDPYHQLWSALRRTTQEMMWQAAHVGIGRDLAAMNSRAARVRKGALGSLILDPAVELPRYITEVDIHCMPGGYTDESGPDDTYAGAMYDRGVYSITQGFLGPLVDGIGRTVGAVAQRKYADLKPSRILDIGCAVGHSTLPLCDAFPEAEIWAIDVGAPMLRYAHARAESLGKAVHYRQMNAESLNFSDGSFDLVVSTATMHELSRAGIRAIVGEMHRVLRPGGVMINVEQPQYEGMSAYDQFMRDWDTFGNAEPFWGTLHDMDLVQLAVDAGFRREAVTQTMEFGDGGQVYRVDRSGEKPKPNWFIYAATK